MEQEIKKQVWTSDILILMGAWLWGKKEYGHALLCFHGSSLGMKVGAQLGITWEDYIDGYKQMRYVLTYDDGKVSKRQLGIYFQDITLEAFKELKIKDRKSFVYTNANTGKVLSTSTLNRELVKFSEEFLKYVFEHTTYYLPMRELKSNAFEIAWGVDMVKKYMLTKKVFMAVSKHMGHRTMHDTYELLGLMPNDEIVLQFNLVEHGDTLKKLTSVLSDNLALKNYIRSTGIEPIRADHLRGVQIQV